MSLRIGEVNRLRVNRKTDIGYMLESDDDQVFLHFNESAYKELKPNDVVDAFLYFDQKGRLAATLKTPLITATRPGFLKVTAIHHDLGVFLDMGIAKELLLSKDDLTLDLDLWPQVGDILYVSLKMKGKFVAKITSKEEFKLKPEHELKLKDTVLAYVQKIGREGINLLTPEGHFIFVHHTMIKRQIRYGMAVEVKVTYQSEKGYSGSLVAQKEVAIYDDANTILTYVIRNNGMYLTADSTPDEIEKVFKMSKKAFKRAIGHLYKERKIDFVNGKTILVK